MTAVNDLRREKRPDLFFIVPLNIGLVPVFQIFIGNFPDAGTLQLCLEVGIDLVPQTDYGTVGSAASSRTRLLNFSQDSSRFCVYVKSYFLRLCDKGIPP